MPKEKVFKDENTLEEGLANATYHWVNYICACGNANILEEHSIRYPLAEFFERKRKADVRLEQTMKGLKYKRYDFFYRLSAGKNEIESNGYIEVKLLKEETSSEQEINRFFADIARLAIAQGDNNLFILFGDRKCLSPHFMHFGDKDKCMEMTRLRMSGKLHDYDPFSIYSKWFAFGINQEQVFNTDDYEKQRAFFCNSHCYDNGDPIKIDGMKIRTKLMAVAPQDDATSPQVVYIWKVCKV